VNAPRPEDAVGRVVEIRPPSGRPRLELRELWHSLEVIYLLVLRDTKVRYKQTLVGVGWSVLQPLLTVAVFTLLFARLVQVPTGGVPYPAFALAALVPWTYFAHALTKCTICLVDNQDLVRRIYFPRLALPIAAVLAGLVDLVIALALLALVLAAYGIVPGLALLALPLFVGLAVLTALGAGSWLAAVNVEYRDVANALPFFTQILLFATPVAYPAELIPEAWRALYAMNPMVCVVNGFRWSLLGSPAPGPTDAISVAVALAVLVGGLYFFRRQEERFADVV
jgi:lipopolysaccharide transport system permease protein